MSDQEVTRYDIGSLRSPVVTADGFMRVTGYASRTGIFEYYNPDGSIRRELRLAEDVFEPDSLASYEGAPMTTRHPGHPVTPRNVRGLAVGTVLQPARQDGEHVAFDGIIHDAVAIGDARTGRLQELSSGYRLVLDRNSGEHPEWGPYDARQRRIRINHLALVEQGRAGPTARLKMDAAAFRGDAAGDREQHPAWMLRADELPLVARARLAADDFAIPRLRSLPLTDAKSVQRAMERFGMFKFRDDREKQAAFHRIVARVTQMGLDGSGFLRQWGRLDTNKRGHSMPTPDKKKQEEPKKDEAPPNMVDANIAAAELAREKARADEAAARADAEKKRADTAAGEVLGLKKQVETLQANQVDQTAIDELNVKIEQLETELAAEKQRADEAEKPDRIKALVASRVALEKIATAVLGRDNHDGVSDRDLMTEVIQKRGGTVETSHSDEHVRGQFDALVRNFARGADALARLRQVATPINQDGTRAEVKSARDEYIDRQRNGWQPKAHRAGKEA